MKKFFVIIMMLFVLISSQTSQNNFTLLDYFSGEYTAYTEKNECETSLNLGFCYMQSEKVNKSQLIGESLKIVNFEPVDALKKLHARVVKTEYLDSGLVIIYAFTDLIYKNVEVDNKKVNVQIAQCDDYTIIGWPLILGSF